MPWTRKPPFTAGWRHFSVPRRGYQMGPLPQSKGATSTRVNYGRDDGLRWAGPRWPAPQAAFGLDPSSARHPQACGPTSTLKEGDRVVG
jgi:hypothetical protein